MRPNGVCLYLLSAVQVAESMQQEVTAKRGELDALQNRFAYFDCEGFTKTTMLNLGQALRGNMSSCFEVCHKPYLVSVSA